MKSISPHEVSTKQLHGYLLGAVSPRPIALASTIDAEGNVNLSPFSFFNVFSAKPPILVFSPSRRVRDNTTKHTLENAMETREVVINVVSHTMVQQMSLSSTEYAKGVNEFKKAGFTELPSDVVAPPRVAESPVQFECSVKDIIPLGKDGGAGNLIVAEVVKVHIQEAILDENGIIDPLKIDTVARMGGNWYTRAKMGLFEIQKPVSKHGIGVDSLPEGILKSKVLTGNDLGILGSVEDLPDEKDVAEFIAGIAEFKTLVERGNRDEIHRAAQMMITEQKVMKAWKLLLADIYFNKK